MFKVFISSTNEEALKLYREAAADVCKHLKLEAITQEDFYLTGTPTVEHCISLVQECDIFLILFGHKYGSVAPKCHGRSFTHMEWVAAKTHLRNKNLIHAFVIERNREDTDQTPIHGEESIVEAGRSEELYAELVEMNVAFLVGTNEFKQKLYKNLGHDMAVLHKSLAHDKSLLPHPDPVVSPVDESFAPEGVDPLSVSTQPGDSAVHRPPATADGAATGWTQISRGARSWRVSVAADRLTFVPHDLRQAAPTPPAAEFASAAVSDEGRVAGLLVDGVLRVSWINRYKPEWSPWFDSTDSPVLAGKSELRLLALAMFGQDGVRCMVASAKATHEITIVWGCKPIEVELTNETSGAGTLAGGMKLWVSQGGQLNGWAGPDLHLDEVTSLDASRGGANVLVGVAGRRNGQSKLMSTFLRLDAPNETARVHSEDLSAPATHLVVVRELDGAAPATILATVKGVVRPFARAQ